MYDQQVTTDQLQEGGNPHDLTPAQRETAYRNLAILIKAHQQGGEQEFHAVLRDLRQLQAAAEANQTDPKMALLEEECEEDSDEPGMYEATHRKYGLGL